VKFSAVQKQTLDYTFLSANQAIKRNEEYDIMQMLWLVNTKAKRSLITQYWCIATARQRAGPRKESARQVYYVTERGHRHRLDKLQM
jgi:hypothetical protein